jgi:uncharacterized Zn-finger protein
MTDSNPIQRNTPGEPQPANTRAVYEVTRSELPLSCPTRAMALWNSHPRVYLPIEKTGQARCPYCSAEFKLID